MKGLPHQAWERFGYWLVIGLALYFVYGFKNSKLGSSRADRGERLAEPACGDNYWLGFASEISSRNGT